jgi:DNA replication and repair protein RecF
VRLDRLWLTDFRNYESLDLRLAPGLTVVLGENGQGKTSLLEAIGYLAALSSFRGVPNDALVRGGSERAVIRAEGVRDDRDLLLEAEIPRSGRGRVAVNRQPLRRARDLLGALRTTVFSPDDLELVKDGPGARRRYLDDLLVALHPRNDALRGDLDRILRQRNTLLRQASGRRPDAELLATLDVWDAKLAETGDALGTARQELVDELRPELTKSYAQTSGDRTGVTAEVGAEYDAPWRAEGLEAALARTRTEELRRGVSLVGPHRDELTLTIGGMPARTHGSQGEQRSLALALRLAAHALVTARAGEPPVLLLDDVFSELDESRAAALVTHLPHRQAVLTTAGRVPPGITPDLVVQVTAGRVGEVT